MKSYRVLGFVVMVLFYLSGAAQADNIILNGSFDSQDNWSFPAGQSGTTSEDGAPASPSAFVGPGGYSIDQTTSHTITAGDVYNVSYWAALSNDDDHLGGSTRVALAYDSAGTLTEIAGASQSLTLTTLQGWQSHVFSFTAQAGQDYTDKAIGIMLVNSGSNGWVGFDTVAVNVVPEPGTLVLIATGLIALLAYAWRKKK